DARRTLRGRAPSRGHHRRRDRADDHRCRRPGCRRSRLSRGEGMAGKVLSAPPLELPAESPAASASRLQSVRRMRELGILLATVLMFVALSVATSKFLTTTNVLNVARQISLLAIVACGMTY